jgi:hypothetical protein
MFNKFIYFYSLSHSLPKSILLCILVYIYTQYLCDNGDKKVGEVHFMLHYTFLLHLYMLSCAGGENIFTLSHSLTQCSCSLNINIMLILNNTICIIKMFSHSRIYSPMRFLILYLNAINSEIFLFQIFYIF